MQQNLFSFSRLDKGRLVVATIVGAFVLSAAGYAVFGILLPDFYSDFMRSGSASGVERHRPLFWAVALGMACYSLLVTLAIAAATRRANMREGMVTGACVSLLLWLPANLMLYGISNVGDIQGTLLERVLEMIPGGLAGGAIALVLRRAPSRPAAG